ncbi:uncharacterized protein SPPG_09494 [Spizellomyces punctatus DAOM BR117]|uniref:Uncharacterized protein n=1 Tax=Spizellomyces punctatus (strain DAOM BR117) TaxID=645134 RepID=A0A0L0H8B5_SPIPD|nr:uncharacterized protein SPPG_09494 [Spizellomyces punctatus DAOM BR117]KNC96933.1 hypothetical protein SPPG_09494 [Spizellomyces punctatus DAOM BR117]|eukprot:XP_016604973.1 hypothetical protein SPPG_09494 [Spizellomyces punctatus DAOM BR117]
MMRAFIVKRTFHTSLLARSAIKKESSNLSPHGGAGIAQGDLQRTKAAVGDKFQHLPPGWAKNERNNKYYELACSGADRAHPPPKPAKS